MANYFRKQNQNSLRLNSFKLGGLANIEVGYRFINFEGFQEVEKDTDYEEKVRLLANRLAGDVGMPVEPVNSAGHRCLAVVGRREELARIEIKEEIPLNPDVVTVSLEDATHPLVFKNAKGIQAKLARRALTSALQKALNKNSAGWWEYGRRLVRRLPDEKLSTDFIQVFKAFYFGFVISDDGEFELVVDPSRCYLERLNLFEKHGLHLPASIVGKRFLYRDGFDLYKIDALGIALAAAKQKFVAEKTNEIVSVYDWVKNRWKDQKIPSIENLSPDAPTVGYKTKGEKSRYALSELLYALTGTDGTEEGEASPHEDSILPPAVRSAETEQIIVDIAPRLWLFGEKLIPSRQMRKLIKTQIFDPPTLRVGQDQTLRTNLETMRRDRFDALKYYGAAVNSDFYDEQLYIVPDQSLPATVKKDVKRRFGEAVAELHGKTWDAVNINYDDRNADSLRLQYNAIKNAVGNREGYALMVLPEQSSALQKKLHDQIKRGFWEQVKTQCASAERILDFYGRRVERGQEHWVVRRRTENLYRSYLRFLALGFLEVNSKWLWKLAEGTLRHDVHIGIDVYKGMAVFTFIYGDADLITFVTSEADRPEKLSADQVEQVLFENVGPALTDLNLCPSSIIFHRDGKVFDTELLGIKRGLKRIQEQHHCLPNDLKTGIVEIHKTSATRPRFYEQWTNKFANPRMGRFARLGEFEGAIATTGAPVLGHGRGTARPLYFELRESNGGIALADIAHDIYALSHLAYSSPGSCMSLPFTIALADKVLRESTPGEKQKQWESEEKPKEKERRNNFEKPLFQTARKGGAVL